MTLRARDVAARMVAACALVTLASSALAQEDAVTRANRGAYEAAIKCFVVDGAAISERDRAGDRTKASYYESKAHQSFNTALKLGQVLGYTGSRMDEDISVAQVRDLPRLVKDLPYYRQAASTCKALGLM